MQKILIVQTSFIGDVVLATSLAEKLHVFFPGAQIDFLVRKGNEGLFAGHPFINKVWVWDRKKNKFANLLKLSGQVKKERYNLLINLQRFFSSGLLTTLSGALQKRGFDKNPFSAFYNIKVAHTISAEGKLHEIERNQLLIADITDSFALKPRLYPSAKQFESVAVFARGKYICIAPCSAWFTKQYPEANWAAFIKIVPTYYNVMLIGAPADHTVCDRIIRASKRQNIFNLCGQLGYLQSAALMKGAVMNYVNDSAPMHFASSVNAPVTAVFCSTVPEFGYGPLSDDQAIIQSTESLPCKPCGLHGYKECPLGHFKCGFSIEPITLINRLYDR